MISPNGDCWTAKLQEEGVYSAEVLDSDSVVVLHGCPCVTFRCLQEKLEQGIRMDMHG